MKAIAIKMKSYTDGVNIVNNNNIEERIFKTVIFSGIVLALFYMLILGNMVFNIIERKSLEADARTLSNEVGNLELQYLSMSNKIDLNFSYALGFKETKTKFATRKSLGSIKVANNEI